MARTAGTPATVVEILRDIADEVESAQTLRKENDELQEIEQAAHFACTCYLNRGETPGIFRESMRRLYLACRRDLTKEEKERI